MNRSPVYKDLNRKNNYVLSVLVLTLSNRQVLDIVHELEYQIQFNKVQVLWLGDNKSMSVGTKRNKLLSIADGDYVCFVDDDDEISKEYIKDILEGIQSGKDMIGFRVRHYRNGQLSYPHRFSREYGGVYQVNEFNGEKIRGYQPNHLCVWKRELALKENFPDINQKEDHRWAYEMTKHYEIKDQLIIEKELYTYHDDRSKSETRR